MNMKLKKLLALLLAMMMAFALVACGDTADTGDDAADDQQVQDDAAADDAAADDTQTSPEGQSLLTILADQFIPAPEVAGYLLDLHRRLCRRRADDRGSDPGGHEPAPRRVPVHLCGREQGGAGRG